MINLLFINMVLTTLLFNITIYSKKGVGVYRYLVEERRGIGLGDIIAVEEDCFLICKYNNQ